MLGIVIVIITDVIIKTIQRGLIPKRTITVQIEIEVKFLLKVLMPKKTIMELIVIEKGNPILSVIQQIQITVRDLFRESKLKMVGNKIILNIMKITLSNIKTVGALPKRPSQLL